MQLARLVGWWSERLIPAVADRETLRKSLVSLGFQGMSDPYGRLRLRRGTSVAAWGREQEELALQATVEETRDGRLRIRVGTWGVMPYRMGPAVIDLADRLVAEISESGVLRPEYRERRAVEDAVAHARRRFRRAALNYLVILALALFLLIRALPHN